MHSQPLTRARESIQIELTHCPIEDVRWFEAKVETPVSEHTAIARSPGMAIGLVLDKLADSFKKGEQGMSLVSRVRVVQTPEECGSLGPRLKDTHIPEPLLVNLDFMRTGNNRWA